MSVMAGMEDLKPAKVIGWLPSSGHLVAMSNGEPKEYEMFVSPNGTLKAREFVPDTTHDQTPITEEQQAERAARRWSGIDQA
jgi:hypothetical protein